MRLPAIRLMPHPGLAFVALLSAPVLIMSLSAFQAQSRHDAGGVTSGLFACTGAEPAQNAWSPALMATTRLASECVFSMGYWKTHPELWPVTSITLGTVSYSRSELLTILTAPVRGNGLLILAHQLIATELNIANGGDPASIIATIAAENDLIGGLVVPPMGGGYLDPASVSALTQVLEDYNNGLIGSGNCLRPNPTHTVSWGQVKILYR
jgi:hypothetical protein